MNEALNGRIVVASQCGHGSAIPTFSNFYNYIKIIT